jgi:hypothetical protein
LAGGGRNPQRVGTARVFDKLCPTPDYLVSFFRSRVLPATIVLLFAVALFAVSARIWLPGDMGAPAPLS